MKELQLKAIYRLFEYYWKYQDFDTCRELAQEAETLGNEGLSEQLNILTDMNYARN